MSAHSGPKIELDELSTIIPVKESVSYDLNADRNHMLSKWYCHESGTARCAIIGVGSVVYEESTSASGNIIIVEGPTTSLVTNTTISMTAENYYYGSGPVSFYEQANHASISPLSMKGTLFWTYVSRYTPVYIHVHAPDAQTTINVYYEGTGVNGTASQSVNVNKGNAGTITLSGNGNWYFSANNDVIMTRTANTSGSGNLDACIMVPMKQSEYIYCRDTENEKTSIHGTPSTSNARYVYDANYPAGTQAIADGAGGDMEVGIPESYLSDTYIIPDDISQYYIIAPNTNTVLVQYWGGSNWITYDTHSFTGTATSPGTESVGTFSGNGANLAGLSNGTWRFKGTDVFYVLINDDSSDEESLLLGYMSDERDDPIQRKTTRSNIFKSVYTKNGLKLPGLSIDRSTLSTSGSAISVPVKDTIDFSNNFTLQLWLKYTGSQTSSQYVVQKSSSFSLWSYLYQSTKSLIFVGYNGGTPVPFELYYLSTDVPADFDVGEWYQITVTKSSAGVKTYIDDTLINSYTGTYDQGTWPTNTNNTVVGAASLSTGGTFVDGEISDFKLYNKALTTSQIKRNYRAFRKRYK